MTTIHARRLGDDAVLPQADLLRLVKLARRSEEIEVRFADTDLPTKDLMRLAESSGAFNFWQEPGEDLYSLDDGEPV